MDFVPRHHNVIRFRRGVVFAKNDFNTVCSWVQFPNDAAWKYDIMISKSSRDQTQHSLSLIVLQRRILFP